MLRPYTPLEPLATVAFQALLRSLLSDVILKWRVLFNEQPEELRMKTFQVIRNGIVFEFTPESCGGYTVTVPALPGCISYGKTFEDAMTMITDAMKGWVSVAREEGIPIPEQFEALEAAAA